MIKFYIWEKLEFKNTYLSICGVRFWANLAITIKEKEGFTTRYTRDQPYKSSTIVIYDFRVVL